jgi:predicted nuclease with RNAse H fold
MIRALGIDLAAQPKTTGVVLIAPLSTQRWGAHELPGLATDDFLVEAGRSVDVIGIDAPLGWPIAFVKAVSAHHAMERWPGDIDRSSLTHRATDRRVKELTRQSPFSVSADKLGITAMRCALLQRRWADELWEAPAPRDGSGKVVETYPAAALRAWAVNITGYKGGAGEKAIVGQTIRTTIIDPLAAATSSWLDISAVADRCVRSDHVLDGLVSALVAIAAKARSTEVPRDAPSARTEGWIHIPTTGLADLRPPT